MVKFFKFIDKLNELVRAWKLPTMHLSVTVQLTENNTQPNEIE